MFRCVRTSLIARPKFINVSPKRLWSAAHSLPQAFDDIDDLRHPAQDLSDDGKDFRSGDLLLGALLKSRFQATDRAFDLANDAVVHAALQLVTNTRQGIERATQKLVHLRYLLSFWMRVAKWLPSPKVTWHGKGAACRRKPCTFPSLTVPAKHPQAFTGIDDALWLLIGSQRQPASATSEEHATEGDLFHQTERQYVRRQRESGGIRCTVWLAPVWVAVGRLKTPDILRMPVPHAKLGG